MGSGREDKEQGAGTFRNSRASTEGLESSGMAHRVINGIAWQGTGLAVTTILSILSMMVLARLIAPREFGLMAIVGIFMGFPRIFTEGAVGQYIVQRDKLEGLQINSAFFVVCLFNAVFAVFIFWSAPFISSFFGQRELISLIEVVAPVFLLNTMALVPSALFQRELNFRAIAMIDLTSFFIGTCLVAIILAWQGFGVWALVMGMLCREISRTILFISAGRYKLGISTRIREIKSVMRFAGGVLLGQAANYLALQGDYFVSGKILGTAQLGYYGKAYKLMSYPANLFGRIVAKVLLPGIARLQGDRERTAAAFMKSLALTALLTMPPCALIIVLAPEIVDVLLGPQWHPVIAPLQILAIGSFFRVAYKVSGTLLLAMGAVYKIAVVQWLYAGLVIGGSILGANYGISGIAVAVVIAVAIQFILLSLMAITHLKIKTLDFIRAHVRPFIISVGILALGFATAELSRHLQFGVIVTLVSTVAAVFILGVLVLRTARQTLLGRHGQWLLITLIDKLPGHLRHQLTNLLLPGLSND